MTSVMAGVAKRHAVEVSCPVVMREFFLVPETERMLFAGVEKYVELRHVEAAASFEIDAGATNDYETLSFDAALAAGARQIKLRFVNPYPERHVRLDWLRLRDASGQVLAHYELEEFERTSDDNYAVHDHFALHEGGAVEVPVRIPQAGTYTIDVRARADQAGNELAILATEVLDPKVPGHGAQSIRAKLVELHDKLLGVQVTPHSPEVEAAYQLFVETAARKRAAGKGRFRHWGCGWWDNDQSFLDGIVDNAFKEEYNNGYPYHTIDWDRVRGFIDRVDFSDPWQSAQAWVVVLTYLLTDYRYLYL